jgi:hypothetical protein
MCIRDSVGSEMCIRDRTNGPSGWVGVRDCTRETGDFREPLLLLV